MSRVLVKDFQLSNAIYKGATVTFWRAVGGVVTAVATTLYAGRTGSETLANPQKLDSNGKQKQPIYVDEAVIAQVAGAGFPSHSTGIINADGIDAALIPYTAGFSGAVAREVAEALDADGPRLSDFVSTPDSVTDFSTELNAAIQTLSGLGGGTLFIDFIVAIDTTIVPRSNVNLVFKGGAYLKWIGSTSGTCFESLSTGVLTNCLWHGLKIDTGASFTGTAFRLHSANRIFADVITVAITGSTSKAFVLSADSTGGGSDPGKRNIYDCYFGKLVQTGICGYGLQTSGLTVNTYDGLNSVVTTVSFGSITFDDCRVRGIDLVDWTDNNNFGGYSLVFINSNNSIGLAYNVASNSGVYNNVFDFLAVNTFGTYTGRIGIKARNTKGLHVKHYYQSPQAEGGILDVDNTVKSYDILYFRDDATNDGQGIRYSRGLSFSGDALNGSVPITLADDAATSIDMKGYGSDENIYFNAQISGSNLAINGIVHCKARRTSGSPASLLLTTSTTLVANTGVMAGTTGTDTKFTVSPAADGKVYFENRTGASVTFIFTPTGFFTLS